ncbi:antirestriction protein [Paraburkholderia bannensis]|uniref:antirestriction protein n=1 Tax=Paraburkholderia bannensis TaxID=765414 RepID=UPI002AC36C49|nr:antirestriction protein [Paraburkholderia bannensis]
MNEKAISANAVPENRRTTFLPKYFTPLLMIRAESMIYGHAGNLSKDYEGAFWEFYELSNGGFYVAPRREGAFDVFVNGNGYEGEVSADAFGVIVTLFVLGSLVWIGNEALREKFTAHYYELREFAKDHAEAAAIFRAID